MPSLDDIWKFVKDIGAIAGLLALPYTIFQGLRRRPLIKFDLTRISGNVFEKHGIAFVTLQIRGQIKNQGRDPNSISKIFLLVSSDKTKRSVLRFGGSTKTLTDKSSNEELHLPLRFEPLSSRDIEITFESPLTGTVDERLLLETEPLVFTSDLLFPIPKHKYQMAFEDVRENLFDQEGNLRNRRAIDLWWTLPNTIEQLQRGNIRPFTIHVLRIFKAWLTFRLRVILLSLGLRD